MTDKEYILTRGNTAGPVVRIGPTVRKPVTIATPAVRTLLDFLHENGCTACPRHLGIDDRGLQKLEFVPGVMGNAGPPLGLSDLEKVGGLIRQLHEVTARFAIPPEAVWDAQVDLGCADLICHNDLAPWNLVRNDDRWVFIDWDNAGPGSRLWDLAYAALTFPPVEPTGDISILALRISALIRGYKLSPKQCDALPIMMSRRARAMAEHLANGAANGVQPMVQLHADGHAGYWMGAARFVDEHLDALRAFFVESLQ